MTIKHMKKNISAEDITTVFDIEIEISEENPNHLEKLILTRKNFYNDDTKRNVPDTTNELLNYFYTKYQINENFYTKDEINERIKIHMDFYDSEEDLPEEGQENYIYLIPFEEGENKEGAFKEYVWTGDDGYEQVGSTDLQPILDKFDEYTTKEELIAHNNNSNSHSDIRAALNNFATKEELNDKADSNHTHTANNIVDSSLNNAMATNFSEVTYNNNQILLSIIEKLHSDMLYIESIKEGLSDDDFQSFGSFMEKFSDIEAIAEDVYSEIDNAVLSHNNNSNAHSDIRAALNNFATKEELSEATIDPSSIDLEPYLTSEDAANTYVAKENNKGLSTNDFTDAYKDELNNMSEAISLLIGEDGASIINDNADYSNIGLSGAGPTSQEAINGTINETFGLLGDVAWTNSYNSLDNKPSIPTTTSQLTNDGEGVANKPFLTEHQDISGKVDKEQGKGLSTNDFTDTYKDEIDNLATNYQAKGNYLTASDISGKVNSADLANIATSGSYTDLGGITTQELSITYDVDGTDVTETITFLTVRKTNS